MFWGGLTRMLEVIAILKLGRKKFPPLKGGAKVLHWLERGGGAKCFRHAFF